MSRSLSSAALLCIAFSACSTPGKVDAYTEMACVVSIADLQYVTVHNAYHIAPDLPVFEYIQKNRVFLYPDWPPERSIPGLNYTHPPIETQLAAGIRAFELDLRDDPNGGRYSDPGVLHLISGLQLDPEGSLGKPGMKTFHIPDIDVRSQCVLFVDCLTDIAVWRDMHPNDPPIFIFLEIKEDGGVSMGAAYEPSKGSPFTDASWERLENEILSVFRKEQLILPEEIGPNSQWPSLNAARGHVAFLLFDYGESMPQRYAEYVHVSGKSPLLHLNIQTGETSPSWKRASDPSTIDRGNFGGLIYTKADTTGKKDGARRDRAMSSSANFLATDFPAISGTGDDYAVGFNSGLVRPICDREQ